MLLRQVALVPERVNMPTGELTQVAAALQKQAARDFGPIWSVHATVDAFERLDDVPVGYWPIIVAGDINAPGASGVHLDRDGQPYALVHFGGSWSLTASHECLEMLADPFGNRLVAGESLKKNQGRVEYLVEVCDPCEAIDFAYAVNGVLVSDFYTPHFFDTVGSQGVRYSYSGAITAPRQVLRGGYLSWHDPVTDQWWQLTYFGKRKFRKLTGMSSLSGSLRERVDMLTPVPERVFGYSKSNRYLVAAKARLAATGESTTSKARHWREQIRRLKRGTENRP